MFILKVIFASGYTIFYRPLHCFSCLLDNPLRFLRCLLFSPTRRAGLPRQSEAAAGVGRRRVRTFTFFWKGGTRNAELETRNPIPTCHAYLKQSLPSLASAAEGRCRSPSKFPPGRAEAP